MGLNSSNNNFPMAQHHPNLHHRTPSGMTMDPLISLFPYNILPGLNKNETQFHEI